MTAAQMRTVREEVGSDPDDATLNGLYDEVQSPVAVALAVLRPRLADALKAAADGSFSVPGAISVSAPAQPTMLLEQIQRLEVTLANETGAAEDDMLIGVTRLTRRSMGRGVTLIP